MKKQKWHSLWLKECSKMMKPKFPTLEEIKKLIFLLDIIEEVTDKYCIMNIKIDLYHLVLFRILFIDPHQSVTKTLNKLI